MSDEAGAKDPGAIWKNQPEEKRTVNLQQIMNRRTEELDFTRVLLLDPDYRFPGAGDPHGGLEPFENLIGVMEDHLHVLVQQGLTLRGVDDNRIGGARELDVRGKPGPPRTDNPVGLDRGERHTGPAGRS